MGDKNDPPKPAEGEKQFTQADVDRMIATRVNEEKKKYADYDDLKAKAEKVDELEASKKSDVDKLTEQVEQLKEAQSKSDQKALRAEVAMAKGLTPAQAKRLAGTSREELEADADEILEAFPVNKDPESTKPGPPSRQPKPDLRGGGDPNEEPVETDPAKLASSVPRL